MRQWGAYSLSISLFLILITIRFHVFFSFGKKKKLFFFCSHFHVQFDSFNNHYSNPLYILCVFFLLLLFLFLWIVAVRFRLDVTSFNKGSPVALCIHLSVRLFFIWKFVVLNTILAIQLSEQWMRSSRFGRISIRVARFW